MTSVASHTAYIAIAYGLAVFVLSALVLWVVVEGRRQRQRLAALEKQGIRRGGGRP